MTAVQLLAPAAKAASLAGSMALMIDSGASEHIVNETVPLVDAQLRSAPVRFMTAGGSEITSCKVGTVVLPGLGTVSGAHQVHGAANLLSVPQLDMKGYKVTFGGSRCVIEDSGGQQMIVPLVGGRYVLEAGVPAALSSAAKVDAAVWHWRFNHLGIKSLSRLPAMVRGLDVAAKEFLKLLEGPPCPPCAMSKQQAVPFPQSSSKPGVMQVCVSDVIGPITPQAFSGRAHYVVTLLDLGSMASSVAFLRTKDEAAAAVIKMVKQMAAAAARRPGGAAHLEVLRADGGGEYVALRRWAEKRGIIYQHTVPHTPQQNGSAEALGKWLMAGARAALLGSGLPRYLWPEAVATANYVRNRSPVSGRDKTPIELLTGEKPDVSNLRCWGCVAYPMLPKVQRDGKLGPVAEKGRFVGYPAGVKGWLIYVPPVGGREQGKIKLVRSVIFDESLPATRVAADEAGDLEWPVEEPGEAAQQPAAAADLPPGGGGDTAGSDGSDGGNNSDSDTPRVAVPASGGERGSSGGHRYNLRVKPPPKLQRANLAVRQPAASAMSAVRVNVQESGSMNSARLSPELMSEGTALVSELISSCNDAAMDLKMESQCNSGSHVLSKRLQQTVATLTQEAEFQAAVGCAREALRIEKMMPELGYAVGAVRISCERPP